MKIQWKSIEQHWRRQLLSFATGNILEVGVGTGANFKHYPIGTTVTATDLSARMIDKAKIEAEKYAVNSSFIVAPMEELSFPRHSFDTIVSTFSLSAYEEPAWVLEQFNHWCKPEGTILLLEYGLSKYGIVNWLQRKWEPYHYKRTGSHIDRDIITTLSDSGLRVKKAEVRYAGTVYLVWACMQPKHEKEIVKLNFR